MSRVDRIMTRRVRRVEAPIGTWRSLNDPIPEPADTYVEEIDEPIDPALSRVHDNARLTVEPPLPERWDNVWNRLIDRSTIPSADKPITVDPAEEVILKEEIEKEIKDIPLDTSKWGDRIIDYDLGRSFYTRSYIRRNIDASWKKRIKDLNLTSKSNKVIFPDVEHKATIKVMFDSTYYITGLGEYEFCINRMYDGKRMYSMTFPVEFKAKISSIHYMNTGKLLGFNIDPAWGFHLMSTTDINKPVYLCLGDNYYTDEVNDYNAIKEFASDIPRLLNTVYLASLGDVRLPKGDLYNKYIYRSKSSVTIARLLKVGLIEPYNLFK